VAAEISPNQSLHAATAKGDLDAMRQALANGAKVSFPSPHMQDTPLHIAVLNEAVDAVHLLLDAGAEIHAQNRDGRTPLHEAAYQKKPEIWNLLSERGADPHRPDNEGITPQSLRDTLAFAPEMVELSQEQVARGMSRSR
jgi:ankyrin repeat protein